VAAYHVFVCVLFPVQVGMWTGYSQWCRNQNVHMYIQVTASCLATLLCLCCRLWMLDGWGSRPLRVKHWLDGRMGTGPREVVFALADGGWTYEGNILGCRPS